MLLPAPCDRVVLLGALQGLHAHLRGRGPLQLCQLAHPRLEGKSELSLLSLGAEAPSELPLRMDLPAGLTPGGFATAYSNGAMYLVSDAADGSLSVGNYSGGPAVQLPAWVGVLGSHLYDIDHTTLVDVAWAAGLSANGSGIGYALDGATGATLATYVVAPGKTASFVGTVSGHGRFRAVFADAGVGAVYSVVHGLVG